MTARPVTVPGTATGRECLLVTRTYPSPQHLYRYPFVHRRVLAYRDHGFDVDVFSLDTAGTAGSHDYEGITCRNGTLQQLDRLLASGRYTRVIVHGLSRRMWRVIGRHIDRIRVVGWLHGSEIHSFHLHDTAGSPADVRESASRQHNEALQFWRALLTDMPANLQLVFVSRFAVSDVERQLDMQLPADRCHVIPNPIDTDLFRYREKPAAQRLRILSIRPFDTYRYANDLSVKVIRSLAHEDFFNLLEFRIVGDGPLFEQTLAPLHDLENVKIERRFLSQPEIAALHRDYGLFLVPTRMDTQGVSRDEAMASGLVPLTNAVSAVPEYANETCAVLAGADEYRPLVDGVRRFVLEPERFATMSAAAARRVCSSISNAHVIPREIELVQSFRAMACASGAT